MCKAQNILQLQRKKKKKKQGYTWISRQGNSLLAIHLLNLLLLAITFLVQFVCLGFFVYMFFTCYFEVLTTFAVKKNPNSCLYPDWIPTFPIYRSKILELLFTLTYIYIYIFVCVCLYNMFHILPEFGIMFLILYLNFPNLVHDTIKLLGKQHFTVQIFLFFSIWI